MDAAEDGDAAELVGINSRGVYARATALAVAVRLALGGLFPAIRSIQRADAADFRL